MSDLEQLWACPHCKAVVAVEDSVYPPGHENSKVGVMGCASCKTRHIKPDDWERVSP